MSGWHDIGYMLRGCGRIIQFRSDNDPKILLRGLSPEQNKKQTGIGQNLCPETNNYLTKYFNTICEPGAVLESRRIEDHRVAYAFRDAY
jgi:hypothetical protein